MYRGAMSMRTKLVMQRINVKAAFIIGLCLGLAASILYGLSVLLPLDQLPNYLQHPNIWVAKFPTMFPVILIAIPVVTLLGGLASALLAFAFNVGASFTGGLTLEFEMKDS